MRRASSAPLPAPPDRAHRGDWRTIGTLLPYLLAYKGRVSLALGCLVAAKLANVGVPLMLKEIVDRLTVAGPEVLILPLGLLVAYGAMRLSTTAFTELHGSRPLFDRWRVVYCGSELVADGLYGSQDASDGNDAELRMICDDDDGVLERRRFFDGKKSRK